MKRGGGQWGWGEGGDINKKERKKSTQNNWRKFKVN